MLVAFAVILIDLIGFGIMIPIFAFYVLSLGGTAAEATFYMALYSVGMVIATPILGRISDYYGRKPVLLISMAGAAAGYLILAFASTLWMVALARLVSGLMAGNIAAAQAYITDVTTEEDRARGMGLIGAAFGLGFIIGPALGGWLAGDSFEDANLFAPAITSAGLSLLAMISVILFLKESLDPKHREALRARPRVGLITAMAQVRTQSLIVLLVTGCLVYNMAAGLSEAILPIWVSELGIVDSPRGMVPMLLAAGVTMAAIQGGLIGPLSRRFGAVRLLQAGCILFVISSGLMISAGVAIHFGLATLGLVVQSAGAALILTSLQSLVSMRADPTERGLVMGVYNSAGNIGRIAGTTATGSLFLWGGAHAQWAVAASLVLVLLGLAVTVERRWTPAPAASTTF